MQSEDTRNEQRDSLQNLSMEVSRERVESLWRQAIARRSSSRSDLTAAKASRARAEVERQRTSHQALESTRDACRTLIAEAERSWSWPDRQKPARRKSSPRQSSS